MYSMTLFFIGITTVGRELLPTPLPTLFYEDTPNIAYITWHTHINIT